MFYGIFHRLRQMFCLNNSSVDIVGEVGNNTCGDALEGPLTQTKVDLEPLVEVSYHDNQFCEISLDILAAVEATNIGV